MKLYIRKSVTVLLYDIHVDTVMIAIYASSVMI
jgi:hypothetical protein